MLSKKMLEALNKQINREFYNAYLYLSMATYLESINLPGFANWTKVQSQEEIGHALKIYKYVNEQREKVKLMDIKQPPTEWKTPLDVFELALKAEQENSKQINELYKLALEEKDYATQNMLTWFIDEQVEEENITDQVVQKLVMIGSSKRGLFMLDKELGGRKPE